mmetsp:Transcript_17060/g.40706  ORF Transcript_17060/g.40706 Transcript_17060/m.40706 type:complete len:117 (+) Transcript_17060:226-576(+)
MGGENDHDEYLMPRTNPRRPGHEDHVSRRSPFSNGSFVKTPIILDPPRPQAEAAISWFALEAAAEIHCIALEAEAVFYRFAVEAEAVVYCYAIEAEAMIYGVGGRCNHLLCWRQRQ